MPRDDGWQPVLCREVGEEGGGDSSPVDVTGSGRERGRPGRWLLEGMEGEEARGDVLPHREQLEASAGRREGRRVHRAREEGEAAIAGAVVGCGDDRGEGGEEEDEEERGEEEPREE